MQSIRSTRRSPSPYWPIFTDWAPTSSYPVSAEHGLGVAELLDAMYPLLPSADESDELQQLPRVAVAGRPNVGKSHPRERAAWRGAGRRQRCSGNDARSHRLTGHAPGSTLHFHRYGRHQTARQGRPRSGRLQCPPITSCHRSRPTSRSLILDGLEGVTEQDTKIAGAILKQGRACILLINKWDLRAGDSKARQEYELHLRRRFPFLTWAPILYGSALKPESIRRLFPLLKDVHTMFTKRIPTGMLNTWLRKNSGQPSVAGS